MKMLMKLFVPAVAGLVVLTLAGCCCGKCSSRATCSYGKQVAAPHSVTTEQLAEMIKNKPKNFYIFDALIWNKESVKIPGAYNVNYKTTDEEIAKLVPDKSARIITYCANPRCSASPKLMKRLQKIGYTNVSEYPSGIQGWIKAGMKTEPAK